MEFAPRKLPLAMETQMKQLSYMMLAAIALIAALEDRAVAQPLDYRSNVPAYDNSYNPYHAPYTQPAQSYQPRRSDYYSPPRYESTTPGLPIEYGEFRSNPYHDPNDRRYDSSYNGQTIYDRYPSGSAALRSYPERPSSSEYTPRRYDVNGRLIPHASGQAPYDRPYNSAYPSSNDGRRTPIYNSGYDRNIPADRFAPVTPSTLSRPYQVNSRSMAQHAVDLYESTNAVCWEMERNYKQNANYATVYRQIYEIKEVAKRLKEFATQQDGRQTTPNSTVVTALQEMDRRFHDFEADVSRWRPDAGYRPQTPLATMIADCENRLHDVMQDQSIDTRNHEASHRDDANHLDSYDRRRPSRSDRSLQQPLQ